MSSLEQRLAERTVSFLDLRIRLDFPPAMWPERGPTTAAYYAAKHARGEYGRFWPLHRTAAKKGK